MLLGLFICLSLVGGLWVYGLCVNGCLICGVWGGWWGGVVFDWVVAFCYSGVVIVNSVVLVYDFYSFVV